MFANLTVDENLRVPIERPGALRHRPGLPAVSPAGERKQNLGRQLSGGEQEMLSIGRALLLNPRLLILDEPSQGLAPLIVKEVFRIVAQMRAEGISVLLVEQNVRMSLEISDHAYVLENGQMVYSGPAAELRATKPASRRWRAPRPRNGSWRICCRCADRDAFVHGWRAPALVCPACLDHGLASRQSGSTRT